MHLPKPVEHATPRVNSNVNNRLWVIMLCQCMFISCNKYTTLVVDVDSEGGAVYGHFYTFLLVWPRP